MSTKGQQLLNQLNKQITHQHNEEQAIKEATKVEQKKEVVKIQVSQKKQQFDRPKQKQLKTDINDRNKVIAKAEKINKKKQPKQKIEPQPIHIELQPEKSYEELIQPLTKFSQIIEIQKRTISTNVQNEVIYEVMKKRQLLAYQSQVKQNNQYLQTLADNCKQKNQFAFNILEQSVSKRDRIVQDELEDGGIIIQKDRNLSNKGQLQLLEQFDKARMIKIKEGQIRSKMDILNDKIQKFDALESCEGLPKPNRQIEQSLYHKVVDIMKPQHYSLNSQKTKQANNFTKKMITKRKSLQKIKQQRKVLSIKFEMEKSKQLKQAQSMKDFSKKQQIIKKIEDKRRQKEKQDKILEQKSKEVKRMIESHNKKGPLFKKMEKNYKQQILKMQEKFYQQKINQIKEKKKVISVKQLVDHQKKYLQQLEDESIHRKQQMSIIMQQRAAYKKNHRYFQGKIRQRVLENDKIQKIKSRSLLEKNKRKINKMKQFGQIISKEFQPTTDLQKKEQLQRQIEKQYMKKNHLRKVCKQKSQNPETGQPEYQYQYQKIPEINSKLIGNRYFEFSKKNIKKKDDLSLKPNSEGAVSYESSDLLKSSKATTMPKSKYKHLWEVRAKNMNQLAKSEVIDAKSFEIMKNKVEDLDQKAVKEEQFVQKMDLAFEQEIAHKNYLDKFYVESIYNKIKLLE